MTGFRPRYVKDYFWQARIRKIFIWILQIAIAVFLAYICVSSLGQRVVVSDDSMEPTLSSGDKILMNTAAYKLSSPSRGDIIVFRTGSEEEETLQIKRVIGLPGETIQIRDGQIYIDGTVYEEENNFETIVNPGTAEETVELGTAEYFVLGDNRNNSEDSRYPNIGLVQRENIVGKLWLRYSPFDQFGFMG